MYFVNGINEDNTFTIADTKLGVVGTYTEEELETLKKEHPFYDTHKFKAFEDAGACMGFIALKHQLMNSNFEIVKDDTNEVTHIRLVKHIGEDKPKIVIPEGVEIISANAFYKSNATGEVVIPDTVVIIYNTAFQHSLIKRVVMPRFLRLLRNSVFTQSEFLEEVIFPEGSQIEELKYNVFMGCKSLKTIKIPDNVTKIGKSCFECCESLEEIELPLYLEELGNACFAECISLKRIKIPEGVKELENSTFAFCESLEEVILPNSLTKIDFDVFSGCKSLRRIFIPERVDFIGIMAFAECDNLEEIIFPRNIKTITPDPSISKIPNLVCKVYRDTYAEEYCKSHNLRYEYLD